MVLRNWNCEVFIKNDLYVNDFVFLLLKIGHVSRGFISYSMHPLKSLSRRRNFREILRPSNAMFLVSLQCIATAFSMAFSMYINVIYISSV